MYPTSLQHEPPQLQDEPQQGLDLLDFVLIFARRKWLLLAFTAAGALGLFLWTLTQPRLYESFAVVLPPSEQQSSSALLGQLGQLGALAGIGGGGSKTPSDMYVELLGSRTVREEVVRKFGLETAYHTSDMDAAQGLLQQRSKFTADKNGFLTIQVRDTDPQRAAALANGYANALHQLNDTLAISQASQRRLFFDQQLEQEKNRLEDAEVALKQTEEKTGVIQLSGQTSALLSQIEQLRANITSHEVQLNALRTSSTEENPEVIRVKSELAGLENQLNVLEGRDPMAKSEDLGVPSSKVPALSLDYIRKEREVQYHQTLFDLLARQLEAARIDEAKAAPIVQILDPAEPSKLPVSPKTKLVTLLGAVLGFILGCIRCFMLYVYDYIDEDPRLHVKMWAIKAALRGRLQ